MEPVKPEVSVAIKPNWVITDEVTSKRVFAALLPDGVWHTVKNGSFIVVDDEFATWIEDDAFKNACPLSSVLAVRVVLVKG